MFLSCCCSLLFLCLGAHQNRLPIADIKRLIQHYSTASFARAWANQLPGCITRIVWISSWTFATMLDYRIKKLIERQSETEGIGENRQQAVVVGNNNTRTAASSQAIRCVSCPKIVQFDYWILTKQIDFKLRSTKSDFDIYSRLMFISVDFNEIPTEVYVRKSTCNDKHTETKLYKQMQMITMKCPPPSPKSSAVEGKIEQWVHWQDLVSIQVANSMIFI